MKIITTAIVMFSSVLSFAQTVMESGNSAELKRVSDRANRASEEVRTLRNEVSALRAKNNELQSQLTGMQEKVSAEITRSQELQAQNERAMNLALDEFKKKFPAVSKLKGTWGQSWTGKPTYTYQSKEAEGAVTLFNDGKYTVITGPNKLERGDFRGDKSVKLNAPKGGWKKNESGFNYLTSFDAFLAS
jgi:TolA-binding protein